MTKKELNGITESLAEAIAVANGAIITTKTIKVGGRETDSRVAEGGLFDLDACRGIAAHALKARWAELVAHMPTRAKAEPVNDGSGPRLGPDGKIVQGLPVPATTVPATTVPATTVPATTVPATTVPANGTH